MKHKISTIATRVYKYGLLPPTENAELVETAFVDAIKHANALVSVEHTRRHSYRSQRTAMFPQIATLETSIAELDGQVCQIRKQITQSKIISQSRKVPTELADQLTRKKSQLKDCRAQLQAQRASVKPQMIPASEQSNQTANQAIKDLRKTIYWGTYLLNEKAAKQAAKSPTDPAYETRPLHTISNRIGVHFCRGIGVPDLGTNTLMQVTPIPSWRTLPSGQHSARGRAARTTLRIRLGSQADNHQIPIWGTFPMMMHRPLPDDARIKNAFVTRRPNSVRVPWRYELCIVLQSTQLERPTDPPGQAGTTAINFGWRLIDGELRVATLQNDALGIREIRLPREVLTGTRKCLDLLSIMDKNFDAAKDNLASWIRMYGSDLPENFHLAFANVKQWKSKHRLAELIGYWRQHRLPGDGAIYACMFAWLDNYRHLGDWERNFSRKLLDRRKDLYRKAAKQIACESKCVALDSSDFRELARTPLPEETKTGGDATRRNRMLAAPGELRAEIIRACAKYHCQLVMVPTKNNTRRCNVCGEVTEWDPARSVIHTCPVDGSVWDQDVNWTDNALEHVASGHVMTVVSPAKCSETLETAPAEISTMESARKVLDKCPELGPNG